MIGAEARAKGLNFETELAKYHHMLEAVGAAVIFKAHPQAQMVHGRWIPVGKGPADWWGTLADGSGVYFESKVRESSGKTPRKTFTLDERDAHQLLDLRRVLEVSPSTKCFIMAAWGFMGQYEFIVHPIQLIWERQIEREYGVSCGSEPHWLPIITGQAYADLVARGRLRPSVMEDIPF